MRIGLFGGTFNPPHTGHRIIAEQAFDALSLDRLIWMPAARSPFKDGAADVSAAHRLTMSLLAASDHDGFTVSDEEIRREPPSYTVDTVRALANRFSESELILLIGGDSWHDFDRWREPEGIRAMARIAVYPRPGSDTDLEGADHVLDSPRIDVSSTEIRQRLAQGKTVAGLIDRGVLAYIRKHRLYGT
ncbi:MAG: nicotinate (nicotinamide) nucleotide adenylyltransferase [Rhodothermales bacterium]|nr:nicotinate (nicotinamide) nucleotide adenylyltransferase [Rhodothermales bacterium]MBO6779037.1 nicotinate (nicotinamide) nucleotide adenylyltransferase [Rhodothermales bacterium]